MKFLSGFLMTPACTTWVILNFGLAVNSGPMLESNPYQTMWNPYPSYSFISSGAAYMAAPTTRIQLINFSTYNSSSCASQEYCKGRYDMRSAPFRICNILILIIFHYICASNNPLSSLFQATLVSIMLSDQKNVIHEESIVHGLSIHSHTCAICRTLSQVIYLCGIIELSSSLSAS